jgi:hypothetical protein
MSRDDTGRHPVPPDERGKGFHVVAQNAKQAALGAARDVRSVLGAAERLVEVFDHAARTDRETVAGAVEELRSTRQVAEARLRDAQELADQALDALGPAA